MLIHAESGSSAPWDPNWFLSTIVQSTAALVAIIGGFLISRLISTVTEKSGYVHRFNELRERKRLTSQAVEEVHQLIQGRTNSWFRDKHLNDYLDRRGIVEIDNDVESFRASGHDKESTKWFAQTLANLIAQAFAEIESAYPNNAMPPEDSAGLRASGMAIPGEFEEEIFENVSLKIRQYRTLTGALNSFRFGSVPIISQITPSWVNDQHNAHLEKESDLKSNLRFIDAELELVSSKLSSLRSPESFIWGFTVLTYFGGVGIFYPLFYMTQNPVVANSETRTRVYLAFFSGFIFLLAYIANDVVKLQKNKSLIQLVVSSNRTNKTDANAET